MPASLPKRLVRDSDESIGDNTPNNNNNKQKLQLELGDQKGGNAVTLWVNSRAKQKKETLLFFPQKDPVNEKPWILYLLKPSPLLFPFYEMFSFPCCGETCTWLTMAVDSEFQFSADPPKAIFAGEMYGSIFVSGQQ